MVYNSNYLCVVLLSLVEFHAKMHLNGLKYCFFVVFFRFLFCFLSVLTSPVELGLKRLQTNLNIFDSGHIDWVSFSGAPTVPVLCANLPQLSIATVIRILSAWQAAV